MPCSHTLLVRMTDGRESGKILEFDREVGLALIGTGRGVDASEIPNSDQRAAFAFAEGGLVETAAFLVGESPSVEPAPVDPPSGLPKAETPQKTTEKALGSRFKRGGR